MSSTSVPLSAFSDALYPLGLSDFSFVVRHFPATYGDRLTGRIKFTAKLLTRASALQHSKALDVVAQALRFESWHALSTHLCRAETFGESPAPDTWLIPLVPAILLLVKANPEVSMPAEQLDAFEVIGRQLAALSGASFDAVLDEVCAALCAGASWSDVRARTPLRAQAALYRFVVDEDDARSGYFWQSEACNQLVEDLDDQWQGYTHFSKPKQKAARQWIENALALQPGFLEAGLALAWIQHKAGEPEAVATLDRFLNQAEALIPKAFRGRILWGQLSNRFYHRMLWLRMNMYRREASSRQAAAIARKLLRFNPNDNLGARYVLPLLLLPLGNPVAAQRETKRFAGEEGLQCAATRAFCAHALGDRATFRRELALALLTLPVLRLFLAAKPEPLPDGDEGFRGKQPDMETFGDFAWPAYQTVPGLAKACRAFLREPMVVQAEQELRAYWLGFWQRKGATTGSYAGWNALLQTWVRRLAELEATTV